MCPYVPVIHPVSLVPNSLSFLHKNHVTQARPTPGSVTGVYKARYLQKRARLMPDCLNPSADFHFLAVQPQADSFTLSVSSSGKRG